MFVRLTIAFIFLFFLTLIFLKFQRKAEPLTLETPTGYSAPVALRNQTEESDTEIVSALAYAQAIEESVGAPVVQPLILKAEPKSIKKSVRKVRHLRAKKAPRRLALARR